MMKIIKSLQGFVLLLKRVNKTIQNEVNEQIGGFLNMLLGTVCSCHVPYAFQSESTLYSCLNVKELLAQSRREI